MGWVEVTSAVGTAGAALVALSFGAVAEIRLFRDRRKTREREDRAQAVAVAAWTEVSNVRTLGPDEFTCDVHAVVQNASDQPIWDVTVLYEDVDACQQQWRVPVMPPQSVKRHDVSRNTWPDDHWPLEVHFRDNRNRLWRRDDKGNLLSASQPLPAQVPLP